MCILNGFSCVQLFATLWTSLLCPWDSPGKNTGVGCHAVLQGIFPTQGLNLSVLHRQTSATWETLKSMHQHTHKKWVTMGSGKYVNWHYCGNHCKIHTYIKALNHVYPKFTQLFLSAKLVTPWTAAHPASLSFTVSWSLLSLTSIESVMPSNHLFPCCPSSLPLKLIRCYMSIVP